MPAAVVARPDAARGAARVAALSLGHIGAITGDVVPTATVLTDRPDIQPAVLRTPTRHAARGSRF